MASFAVTTRTLATSIEGLAAGIEGLEASCPSAVVLEAASTQQLPGVVAAVQVSGMPVLAVIGGLFGDADADPFATLDTEEASAVMAGLRATIPGCARLGCERLVVPVATAPRPGVSKEQLADRLCRRLHALAAGEPGLCFLLLASTAPDSPFDRHVAAWIMDDLAHANVGTALDQLSSDGHEPWFAALGDRLGLVLLGDGLDTRPLSAACGHRIPWAIRGPAT